MRAAAASLLIALAFILGFLAGMLSMLLIPEPDILDCIAEVECAMDQAMEQAKQPTRIAM